MESLVAASDAVSFPNGNTCVPSPWRGQKGKLWPNLHNRAVTVRVWPAWIHDLGVPLTICSFKCYATSWRQHLDSPGAPQRASVKGLRCKGVLKSCEITMAQSNIGNRKKQTDKGISFSDFPFTFAVCNCHLPSNQLLLISFGIGFLSRYPRQSKKDTAKIWNIY